MFARPTAELREELLGLTGIGPETADSILLYAANREVFVVDSYTRRIFERHGLGSKETPYEEIRLAVQEALAVDGDGEDQRRMQPQEQGQLPHPSQKRARMGHPQEALAGAEKDEDQPQKQRQKQGQLPHPSQIRARMGHPLAAHEPSEASRMERSGLAQRYNEFHALLVQTAKHFCVKGEPKCESCPLREMLKGKLPPD
jgi:hypothetical protein